MFYIILVLLIVAVDQITKALVSKYIKPVKTYPLVKNVFHLTYRENTGAAYSMFSDRLKILIPLTLVSIVIMIGVFARNLRLEHYMLNNGMCFIIGGALGNLIDRIRLGYVVDFFDVRIKHGAVFNIADTFIVTGVLILCYLMIFQNLELI